MTFRDIWVLDLLLQLVLVICDLLWFGVLKTPRIRLWLFWVVIVI
jgi:hypothetical protein